MTSTADRRRIVKLINQARDNGARLQPACEITGICSRTYVRWHENGEIVEDGRPEAQRPVPANKLTPKERQEVIAICNNEEFKSLPPSQIVPRLADRGRYVASESSFYRILREAGMQNHRGRSHKPTRREPPQGFCATGPNMVWSWDVTWLPTHIRGMFYYLYTIIDVYSRKIVGWEVHTVETGELASQVLQKAILSEQCILNPPVLHADNGGPQRGFTLRAKMESLGVTASYSRPRVSNDNPYSESLFRTLKYRPAYPEKGFLNIESARLWVTSFTRWYNDDHLHSNLRFVSPSTRHKGMDPEILKKRKAVYRLACARHPERWSNGMRNWNPVGEVWLNPPQDTDLQEVHCNKAA